LRSAGKAAVKHYRSAAKKPVVIGESSNERFLLPGWSTIDSLRAG
jgi:hypothetical protein